MIRSVLQLNDLGTHELNGLMMQDTQQIERDEFLFIFPLKATAFIALDQTLLTN
jgi:hypothetical protein